MDRQSSKQVNRCGLRSLAERHCSYGFNKESYLMQIQILEQEMEDIISINEVFFFSYSVVASAISVVETCRDISLSTGDGQWHNRLVKQAGSVPGCPLDSAGGCGRKKVTAKLSCLMERMSRPLQDTPSARGSVRDMLLLRLWRVKDRNCLPAAAVRLYNQPCSHQTKHTTTERFTRVISVYPKTLQYQYSLCVTQIQFW